jgi:hypothetical protein
MVLLSLSDMRACPLVGRSFGKCVSNDCLMCEMGFHRSRLAFSIVFVKDMVSACRPCYCCTIFDMLGESFRAYLILLF